MGKSSQLSQLKASLASSGLSRTSQPGANSTRKRTSGDSHPAGGAKRKRGKDEEKALEKIRRDMNPFEERVMRTKHDVGGKALKGSSGRPGHAAQKGLQNRQALLLPALLDRGHTASFVDSRFGEHNSTLTPEEKMLERFTREKEREQREGGRKRGRDLFNLGDGDDEEELTHGGKIIDDFEAGGWGGRAVGLSDDEDLESGQIDARTVDRGHFGGFDDAEEDDADQPERKKTKNEVMAEIIAKSKDAKYERQLAKERDEVTRQAIDDEFGDLRELLMGIDPTAEEVDAVNADAGGSRSNLIPLGTRVTGFTAPKAEQAAEGEKEDYDAFVRSLAYDRRAKPTDRTKTEEELALEEKDELEKLEKARLARMRGEEPEVEEKKGRKKRGADDLEDDFVASGDEDGEFGLGTGLVGAAGAGGVEMVTLDAGSDSEEEEEGESGVEDGSEDEEEGSDEDEEEDDFDDLEDGEGEAVAEESEDDNAAPPPPPVKKAKSTSKATKDAAPKASTSRPELPYTFPMPSTHVAFLSLLDTHHITSAADTGLVIKRIRALYHPKLGEGNKERLQVFLTVLLDHMLDVLSPPTPAFDTLQEMLPHLTALTTSFPLLAAQHTISKLVLIQKNLTRGLSRGALDPDAKTWPGPQELGLLRVIGATWSTSDFNHPVGRPAMLYMGQCLSQARVRGGRDLASGLFLCTLVLQYESLSKRYMPEVVNFLALTLLLLAPHSFTPASYPGSYPLTELDSPRYAPLKLKSKSTLSPSTPDLPALLVDDEADAAVDEQDKTDLFATALLLVSRFATLWGSLEAFAEVFGPMVQLLEGISTKKLSPALKKCHASTLSTLSNQLRLFLESRRPLLLQQHKPIPIPSYIPKFEGSHYTPGKVYDPDTERNNLAKLRKQLKEEKKGAIRELRKDARFLAGERNRMRDEKDQAYDQRMRSAHGAITVERGEEKAMEREKAREKRRAGK